MKIEFSLEDLKRIMAALETEEDQLNAEIKSIENFEMIGTCSRMDSRQTYLAELKEELSILAALGCRLGEVCDANDKEAK